MDANRAKQIVQSKDNIDVYLNGRPVWINQVNNDEETARVRDIMNDNETTLVSLVDLIEGQQ